MLEPTKEPVKPVSAAEMIASIAQSPSVATELNTCPPDTAQVSVFSNLHLVKYYTYYTPLYIKLDIVYTTLFAYIYSILELSNIYTI